MRLSAPGTAARVALPLMIEVEDTGPGVADSLKAHLFDPCVTTKAQGNGPRSGAGRQDHRRPRRRDRNANRSRDARSFACCCRCRTNNADNRSRKWSMAGGTRSDMPDDDSADPHRAQPGLSRGRAIAACDRQRRHAVALGCQGEGDRRHHRCGDARTRTPSTSLPASRSCARICRSSS